MRLRPSAFLPSFFEELSGQLRLLDGLLHQAAMFLDLLSSVLAYLQFLELQPVRLPKCRIIMTRILSRKHELLVRSCDVGMGSDPQSASRFSLTKSFTVSSVKGTDNSGPDWSLASPMWAAHSLAFVASCCILSIFRRTVLLHSSSRRLKEVWSCKSR